jgi:hypothetical protein
LIEPNSPSRRRRDAFDLRGPPELIQHVSISEVERQLIVAFALQRLKSAHVKMDLTRLGEHQLEKSQ